MSTFEKTEFVSVLHIDNDSMFKVGDCGCTSISVVFERGQMAGVPWFEVFINDKLHSKWNGATILGVEI